jgi:IS1 family transposase
MGFGSLLKNQSTSTLEAEEGQGKSWIWTAVDVPTRLMAHHIIADRTLEQAEQFMKGLKSRMSKQKPLFVSDDLAYYAHALVHTYSTMVIPPPTGKPGRPEGPQSIVDADIDYATVHKIRSKGRVVKVERSLALGENGRLVARLENSSSNTINTSFVERSNLTWRMMNAHLSRKSLCFSKSLQWLKAKFAAIAAIYNFVRPHSSLSPSKNQVAPAMAAKITTQPWSMDQLLGFPVTC